MAEITANTNTTLVADMKNAKICFCAWYWMYRYHILNVLPYESNLPFLIKCCNIRTSTMQQ